jgi:hypothetical protein
VDYGRRVEIGCSCMASIGTSMDAMTGVGLGSVRVVVFCVPALSTSGRCPMCAVRWVSFHIGGGWLTPLPVFPGFSCGRSRAAHCGQPGSSGLFRGGFPRGQFSDRYVRAILWGGWERVRGLGVRFVQSHLG